MNDIPPRSRIRRSPEQIEALLTEFQASGLSLRKFAPTRGISTWTLCNWVRRYRSSPRKEPRLIEVHARPGSFNAGSVASVRFTDGLSIELHSGFQAAPVAELVKLLRKV